MKLTTVAHGGDILAVARALGCKPGELADMSSNLAPFGPPPGVRETISEHLEEIAYLPEPGSESLSACLAAKYGRSREEILVGNGTTEFIFGLPAALQPKRGVIVNPTYGDYRLACTWAGVAVQEFTLNPAEGFVLNLERLTATLLSGDLVFLCNPNNPTGVLTPSRRLHEFIAAHPGTTFLVDEAYLPFTGEESLLALPPLANLLVLNSYSKIFCIPGLRLGILVGDGALLTNLDQRAKPWGVNRLAQVAGEYLCRYGDDYIQKVVAYVARERERVATALAELPGVAVVAGRANFILGCLTTGALRAGELRTRLLAKRLIIRNCANFTTLDDRYFRISLKDGATNRRCLAALAEIFDQTRLP